MAKVRYYLDIDKHEGGVTVGVAWGVDNSEKSWVAETVLKGLALASAFIATKEGEEEEEETAPEEEPAQS